MADWIKEEMKLKKGHGWRARPGYLIFVADRGAVRFDIPQSWILELGENSTKFYDAAPPDDNCRLEVSYLRLPPIDWSGLPLRQLVEDTIKDDHRNPTVQGKMHELKRPDLEMCWTEMVFTDPVLKREARSRICIARGSNILPIITMDFWPEDAGRLNPVWNEVLRSLQVGHYIEDPTRGPLLQ